MSDVAVEVDCVWKKFHRGEFHDSLRDAIPALVKRLLGRGPNRRELGEGDFWALRDVSFQVRHGEVLGIIGANGAGKSTLLKILARILKPNRGRVQVHGRLRALIEIAAGFHGDLTGRENIYLNGCILGMKKREIDAKFDQIVDFSGIEPFLDTPVKRYSSGMYARLGFAVAAHLDPEILVVDEVLAVGDAEFQRKCLGKMERVAGEGRTVLFVSHNMVAVENLCHRAILLEGGAVQAEGPTAAVIGRYLATAESNTGFHDLSRDAAQRAGTGEARFQNAELLSSSGERISSLPMGEGLTVRVAIEARSPVRDAAVGVGLYTLQGLRLCGLNSRDLHDWTIDLEPGGRLRVELRIPRINFSPGTYVLNLALYGPEGECADSVERALAFEVAPTDVFGTGRLPKGSNVVFLDHEWATLPGC